MSNKLERISMMVFGILFILFCAEAQADVTYSYSGNPYTNVSGSYTTSMRVTGHFTIAAPLSPNLPMTDIRPSVLGYSFFDGVQTLTDSNSKIIVLALSTDASGQIQEWRVTIWEIPITGVFGGVVRGIDAIFTGGFVDDKGFTDGSCISVNGGLCDSANINVGNFGFMSSANPADAGSWNSSAPTQSTVFTSFYTGDPFTVVSGSYTTSMRVTGHFTIAAPLSPNLPMTDIRPSVLGYSFFDGVQTLTDANSSMVVISVSTDASGQIQEWRVTIWEIPITGVFGGVVRGIDAIFTGGFVDDKGFTDGSCISVNGGLCDSANINVGNFGFMSSANPTDAGSWNSSVQTRIPVTAHTYTGDPFTVVSGSYTTSMRVTGSLTLDRSLMPNMPLTNISLFSVLDYSFFDGVQTLTDSNSKIIVLALSTDASGQIQEWRVTIWEIPITGVFGGVVRGIDAIFTGGFVDDKGFTDGSCISVNGGLCDSVNINVGNFGFMSSANPDDAGSWNSSVISQEKMSVPTINEWGMIIFMVLACIGSIYYVRRKRIDG